MFNDDIRKNVPARVIQFSPPDICELEIEEVAEALTFGMDHNRTKNKGIRTKTC